MISSIGYLYVTTGMYHRSLAIADMNVIIASKEKSILGEDLLVRLKKTNQQIVVIT